MMESAAAAVPARDIRSLHAWASSSPLHAPASLSNSENDDALGHLKPAAAGALAGLALLEAAAMSHEAQFGKGDDAERSWRPTQLMSGKRGGSSADEGHSADDTTSSMSRGSGRLPLQKPKRGKRAAALFAAAAFHDLSPHASLQHSEGDPSEEECLPVKKRRIRQSATSTSPRTPGSDGHAVKVLCCECRGSFTMLKAIGRCATCYQRYYRRNKQRQAAMKASAGVRGAGAGVLPAMHDSPSSTTLRPPSEAWSGDTDSARTKDHVARSVGGSPSIVLHHHHSGVLPLGAGKQAGGAGTSGAVEVTAAATHDPAASAAAAAASGAAAATGSLLQTTVQMPQPSVQSLLREISALVSRCEQEGGGHAACIAATERLIRNFKRQQALASPNGGGGGSPIASHSTGTSSQEAASNLGGADPHTRLGGGGDRLGASPPHHHHHHGLRAAAAAGAAAATGAGTAAGQGQQQRGRGDGGAMEPAYDMQATLRMEDLVMYSVPTRRLRPVELLVTVGLLKQGDRVHYRTRAGQVKLYGTIRGTGILCDSCGQQVGCTEFERCAGSALRRPTQNIFTSDGECIQDLLKRAEVLLKTERQARSAATATTTTTTTTAPAKKEQHWRQCQQHQHQQRRSATDGGDGSEREGGTEGEDKAGDLGGAAAGAGRGLPASRPQAARHYHPSTNHHGLHYH